jgi:hypothetical protein
LRTSIVQGENTRDLLHVYSKLYHDIMLYKVHLAIKITRFELKSSDRDHHNPSCAVTIKTSINWHIARIAQEGEGAIDSKLNFTGHNSTGILILWSQFSQHLDLISLFWFSSPSPCLRVCLTLDLTKCLLLYTNKKVNVSEAVKQTYCSGGNKNVFPSTYFCLSVSDPIYY